MANELSLLGTTKGLLAATALLTVAVLIFVLTSAIDVLNDDETLDELPKRS